MERVTADLAKPVFPFIECVHVVHDESGQASDAKSICAIYTGAGQPGRVVMPVRHGRSY